ncbi:hypothetical protein CPC08DRAFT_375911 [Agrocybe pediades]|nr:hypothetical protein CPC08DRAFT_375911 [Agrocybe pediades]
MHKFYRSVYGDLATLLAKQSMTSKDTEPGMTTIRSISIYCLLSASCRTGDQLLASSGKSIFDVQYEFSTSTSRQPRRAGEICILRISPLSPLRASRTSIYRSSSCIRRNSGPHGTQFLVYFIKTPENLVYYPLHSNEIKAATLNKARTHASRETSETCRVESRCTTHAFAG